MFITSELKGGNSGDPAERVARYTEWELQQVVNNKKWLNETDFYLNGKKLTDNELEALGIVR